MKCLEVPFYSQETLYTCGPASLKMVLAYFGINVSETDLAFELGTNDATGTERDRMSLAISSRQLIPHERTDASLEDIRLLLSQGVPAIVRFLALTNDTDHYGVVVGMDKRHIMIHDPWSGAATKYDLGRFYMRWPCEHERGQTCWLLGVGPEKVTLD